MDVMSRASGHCSDHEEAEPKPETLTKAPSPLMRGMSGLPLLFGGVPVDSSLPRSPESQTVKLRLSLLGIHSDRQPEARST